MLPHEKCQICGKEVEPNRFLRCEEHHRCDVCGTKENLIFSNGGLYCHDCREELVKKQVAEFDGDTQYTDEIICPWCGYKYVDSWEYPDNDEEECSNCGNKFSYTRDYDITYISEKIESPQDVSCQRHCSLDCGQHRIKIGDKNFE